MRDLDAREVHLLRVLEGEQRLRPQRIGATIPEESRHVGRVERGRAVARHRREPGRHRRTVAEVVLRQVTRGAADLLIGREPRVEEDGEAERRCLEVVGLRVAVRGRERRWKGHRVQRRARLGVERVVEIARRLRWRRSRAARADRATEHEARREDERRSTTTHGYFDL
jgi:hypothetical protein